MDLTQIAPSVVTMGCRLNACESDLLREHAAAAGLANAVIVNTCAVTGEAVRQATQAIRRIRREQPRSRIVVTGCAAQTDTARFAAMPEVDHIVGNAEKLLPETFRTISRASAAPATSRVMVCEVMTTRATSAGAMHAARDLPRAFVEIQNGCDHRCTFCIIPFGRGPSRSVPATEIVARIRRLVAQGIPEIVLTGVDITAWGEGLGERPGLGRLVRLILGEVPELPRLRLSSIDQAEADPSLLAAFAEEPRLMPHLHLSLQSGSDLILKRMKRRHSRRQSIDFCNEIRRLRPDIAIGADLIAGFPTETEAHLCDTLSIVDECELSFLHVFPYSPRPQTPAARMPQVDPTEIKHRAARLRRKGEMALTKWLDRQVGSQVAVALERAPSGATPGRTRHFAQVTLHGATTALQAGDEIMARVTGHDGRRLLAETMP